MKQRFLSTKIDGTGKYDIHTGIAFLDHMPEQLARHSLMDITLHAKGDLHIDAHHTTEDTGWAIGDALKQALAIGPVLIAMLCLLPMDECLSRVALDVSGRPFLIWHVDCHPKHLAQWKQNCFANGFRPFQWGRASPCMLK